MKSFDEVLPDVFGERHTEFSPVLRERLEQVYREGLKQGLYLEREHLPVPEEVFKVWERPNTPSEGDPRRAPGRLGELDEAKKTLIELIETLAIEVDHCFRPERTLGLGGDDLAKGRHQFLTRTQTLMRTVDRALTSVREAL